MIGGLNDLKVYRLAVRLEIFVYKVVDKQFPKEEQYRSSDQLKRSSASVVNNIAESYGKYSYGAKINHLFIARAESYGKYSYGAKINHLFIARGEIEETRSGFQRAEIKGFISGEMSVFIFDKYTELLKMLNTYIKFLKNKTKSLIN
ncbi:four helix bundle protein [Candidatus Falkowbacteria bacterium]|nr:four helix bundle protein [Candidatus Falkowbacteria bacterium]